MMKEWIYEVAEDIYPKREDSRNVYQRAVFMFNKVVDSEKGDFNVAFNTKNIQMFGLVCLKMAINHIRDNLTNIPCDEILFSYCLDGYKTTEYIACENDISSLNPFDEMEENLVLNQLDTYFSYHSEDSMIKDIAYVLCDSYLLYYNLKMELMCQLAPVCVTFSRRLFYKKEDSQWNVTIESFFKRSFGSVQIVYNQMYKVVMNLHDISKKKLNQK